ncbi:chaperone modulator CbpM [Flavobacterium sp. RHBU_24]|uniref:chaperone modulator CbpM n=1 Tax=Flavobacterium sp. RHBU_24 TaxID=3391185 RepID=UPI003985284D
MENTELIPLDTFSIHYHVEASFINALYELQVVEIITHENVAYIAVSHLPHLEKLIRLHNDFKLDSEALAVAVHLLDKIGSLQTELNTLRSRLNLYE